MLIEIREIKYRVWYHHKGNHDNGWMEYLNTGINQLYQNSFILTKRIPINANGYYVSLDTFRHDKDFAIMQFIGKTDLNGTEIYEGDVLKDAYGRIMLVEWWKCGFCFKAITETNFLRAMDITQWFEKEEAFPTIIGNCYENPSLITELPLPSSPTTTGGKRTMPKEEGNIKSKTGEEERC